MGSRNNVQRKNTEAIEYRLQHQQSLILRHILGELLLYVREYSCSEHLISNLCGSESLTDVGPKPQSINHSSRRGRYFNTYQREELVTVRVRTLVFCAVYLCVSENSTDAAQKPQSIDHSSRSGQYFTTCGESRLPCVREHLQGRYSCRPQQERWGTSGNIESLSIIK